MWILNWLPDWLFYVMFFTGVLALVIGKILVPLRLYAYPAGVALIIMGTWYSGGIAKDKEWKEKVAEVEAKLAIAQQASAVVNEKIITKVITKNQIIKLRGDDIVKYIDKEVIKYDNTCKIPLEVIVVHNMAAKHD
jgi:hypothetical protein